MASESLNKALVPLVFILPFAPVVLPVNVVTCPYFDAGTKPVAIGVNWG